MKHSANKKVQFITEELSIMDFAKAQKRGCLLLLKGVNAMEAAGISEGMDARP